jgi:hypothetical protein
VAERPLRSVRQARLNRRPRCVDATRMEHPPRSRWVALLPLLLGILTGLVAIKLGLDGLKPAY